MHPFYVTEARAARGELAAHKILLAGESDFVKDSTYRAVVDYVKGGGTAIVVRGGFARNEYGDPRDTSELIRAEGGEPYGDDARVHALGKGRVIRMDTVTNRIEPVKDGGQWKIAHEHLSPIPQP